MATCKNCGIQIEDGVKFCPGCGANQEEVAAKTETVEDKLKELNNTKDTTAEFDPKDIEQNKVMGILAYLSWLVLIPILAAPNSKFARYHANQGLVLAIAGIIVSVVGIVPIIGWIVSAVGGLLVFILAILGIVNAVNGKAKELPIVGKFKILK